MKVQLLDEANTPIQGWKYWALIASFLYSSFSIGGNYPDLGMMNMYQTYIAGEDCEVKDE